MKIAVLGSGIMGSGIAQIAAMAGSEAYAYDVAAASLTNAQEGIQRSLSRLVRAEKMTEAESQATFDRIRFTQDLAEAVSEADVVIEAAPEILELKQELWRAVVSHAPVGALLGTNTSQLSVTRIASCLDDNSSRLVGIHFFNPPVMMKLVELISGINTDPAEIERASEFAQYLGKEVVVCRKDSPGFITSRAYAILRLECVRMLEEGIATAEDIDKALRLGFNFPMGPLELGDMNGIDTYVHALTGLAEAHGERFRPTVGLKNMVAAGRLGRKSGRGFYGYDREGRRESNSDN
ncbi:MAG: 3-hydroxyacyl-CoA dehydrogenase family protein [Actinobacteria bacterium]|nr:3-hydroxyacyl-CoA dehydrogenase family protein [Actinomycetota bacterium]